MGAAAASLRQAQGSLGHLLGVPAFACSPHAEHLRPERPLHPACRCPWPCLLQLISMAAKRTGGSKDAGAEGAADAAEDPAQLGPDAPALPAIARRGSEQQNGDLLATALSSRVGVAQGDAAAQALQHQRLQLRGVNGASGGFNALLSNSSGGSGAIRAGSQSPHGPETPVEGGGSRLPLHPTARHGAGEGFFCTGVPACLHLVS